MNEIRIFCDGGSRGNPGPGAWAFVVYQDTEKIFEDSEYLGIVTNNFAEYSSLINALEWLSSNLEKFDKFKIEIIMDSELVVKQIAGEYKVKSPNIKHLFEKAKSLLEKNINAPVYVRHSVREKNKEADALVNKTLNESV